MRHTTFLFAILLSVLPCFSQAAKRSATPRKAVPPSATQKQQFANDQEAINALHSDDIKGSMALDANALESLWTDDIVTIGPGGPPVVGKAANRAKLDENIQQMKETEIVAYDEQFEEVRVVGDWAFEYGVISGRTRPFSGGQENIMKVNVLRVLKREPDGNWKIARSIFNSAVAPPAKPVEPPKPPEPDKNKLKD